MVEAAQNEMSFENALAELDRVVRDLEDGQIGLEDSLARYEAGIGLIRRCQAQLQKVEQRIRLLTSQTDEGEPQLEAFAPQPGPSKGAENKRTRKKRDDSEQLF